MEKPSSALSGEPQNAGTFGIIHTVVVVCLDQAPFACQGLLQLFDKISFLDQKKVHLLSSLWRYHMQTLFVIATSVTPTTAGACRRLCRNLVENNVHYFSKLLHFKCHAHWLLSRCMQLPRRIIIEEIIEDHSNSQQSRLIFFKQNTSSFFFLQNFCSVNIMLICCSLTVCTLMEVD